MNNGYLLAPDTWLAAPGNTYVLLDLPGNRYLAFTDRQAAWLSEIRGTQNSENLSPPARLFADSMVRRGLLTTDYFSGKPIQAISYTPPVRSVSAGPAGRPAQGAGIAIAFFRLLATTATLRAGYRRNLQGLLNVIRRQKSDLQTDRTVSADLIPDLTDRFETFASIFLARRDTCLFRSLLLTRYLYTQNVGCDWIFAVRLAPFSAHCWVEAQGILLNETCERAREYCPVMRV